jgi:hypothetical protein
MDNEFLVIFVITVLAFRICLYMKPLSAPTIAGFRTHHYMYGLIGIGVGLAARSLLVYAIGWAMFVDELTFVLIRGKNHADNYSLRSLAGTALLVIAVALSRRWLLMPFAM